MLGRWFNKGQFSNARHGCGALLWIFICALILAPSANASEANLRVAFVYNFSKFIEWPQGYGETFNLCALGADNAMHQALDQLGQKAINKHPIQLYYLNTTEQLQKQLPSCQMLYWPSSGKQLEFKGPLPKGVVLVADDATGADSASITLARNSEGRIEFLIDQDAITEAGVVVSSQLLKLAKNYQAGSN